MTQEKAGQLSRRKVLIGMATAGVAAGAGGIAYAVSQAGGEKKPISQNNPDLLSVRIGGDVPSADPASALWKKAEPVEVALGGQTVIKPLRPEPAVPSVRARSLHNGDTIAFLLEWGDADRRDLSIKIDQFRDACGVLVGPSPVDVTVWTMGAADKPVTILQWRADWQLDIDAGFQDLEVAFPNVSFDYYPPFTGRSQAPKVPDEYPEEARLWLPGWKVGNPISQPEKTSPVQKLIAIGPGTLEGLPTQNATGRGIYQEGRWRVVLARKMSPTDDKEVTITPGQEHSLAFTVWTGVNHDIGSRKSLTQLGKLRVEA